jgi:BexC/CtrB/KpsE family polysaccharide export inner-membrane protein
MIQNGFNAFNGKRVLMLQGPLGPFFRRLSKDLESIGAEVYKINFNGGDWLFYPRNAIVFRGTLDEWPAFLERILDEHNIDIVLLFGDCRRIHRMVKAILTQRRLKIGVFEEGYIRPDYITLELSGTNGNSQLSQDPDFYLNQPLNDIAPPQHVGKSTYWYMAMWAVLYYASSAFLKPLFPRYQHHRPLKLSEVFPWIRSAGYKFYFRQKEKDIQTTLTGGSSGNYFLVPLQVHNDSQLSTHSKFDSVREFIEQVVESFTNHAPAETMLVIKHHPMDRGYYNYSSLIDNLTQKYSLQKRLFYIHDQHLPTLLQHSRGVVLINSTVGLSALDEGIPLIVLGKAIYNMDGITFQGCLDEFWNQAKSFQHDVNLFNRFRQYVITHTQLNGSYYKRLNEGFSCTGFRELNNYIAGTTPLNNQPIKWLRSLKTLVKSINPLFLFTVLVPTTLSIIYFGLIASDVYISESRFVVRNPERQMPTGLGAIIQGAGFSRSQDDTYNVHEFMLSRDALRKINTKINLREIFGKKTIDLFNRFNSLGFDNSTEALFRYYQNRVAIDLNSSSSISVLKVRTFNPEDSYRINEMLLQIGEQFINRLNERGRQDLIRFALSEVNVATEKSKAASQALSTFRNKQGLFDTEKQSSLQLQQISKLQDELIMTKTQLNQVQTFTPESPQIPTLKNRIVLIQSMMDSEMAKVAGGGTSLTNKAVAYEHLVLDRSVADKQLAAAMVSLEQARSDAQRKQLYLERIVQPNKPDIALEPYRGRGILSVFLLGLITWGILTMLIAGVREHND